MSGLAVGVPIEHKMSDGLLWRVVRERIAKGLATGVLCREDQVRPWMDRLRVTPLFRMADEDRAHFLTGATVLVTASPERVVRTGQRGTPTLWLDEGDLLDAPLPAPKPEE